jgi:hypothetical protein
LAQSARIYRDARLGRFAAHRFFCACDIRFRAAADILREPRLAALWPPRFAARRPLAVGEAALADAHSAPFASPRCLAQRAFWASEMRFRASGDIVRGPRFPVPPAVLLAFAPESELIVVAVATPPRLAAQYFFIRSPTALRWAANMVRRARGRENDGEVSASELTLPVERPLTVPLRSSGNSR